MSEADAGRAGENGAATRGGGSSWVYGGLAGLIALVWLGALASRPLFNTDEGRYAEIPREMLASGDWVVPHLNGLAYIEKPPLQYWATALSLRLLGPSEFAARLYTGLTALGTLAVVFLTARRLWDRDTAWRAAAVLASLLLFLILGQLLTLDMSLTFYMTLALCGFLMAQRVAGEPGAGDGGSRRWMVLAWAATALGVLTKGLVAAAIPTAVLVLYSAGARDRGPWRRLYVGWGVPVFLAIAAPWFWLAAQRLPDFLEFFFVREHLARFLTPVADRQEAWWFFGAVFVAGSVPWTLSALRVVAGGWRTAGRARSGAGHGAFNMRLFLWLWILFVIGFFSLSDSKLMPYVLPAMPALALLIASLPSKVLARDFLITAGLTVIVAVGLMICALSLPRIMAGSARAIYFLPLAHPLMRMAALLGVSGAYVLVRRARDPTSMAVILGAGWCLAWLLLVRSTAAVAPIYSGAGLAGRLVEAVGTAGVTPVYSVGTYDQTLPFYWRRTVQLVAYRGELDYGLSHQPSADIASVDEFLSRWSNEPQACAVMEISLFEKLLERGVPMRELGRDVNRVLVARR